MASHYKPVFQKHSRGDGKLDVKKENLIQACQGLFIEILVAAIGRFLG